MAIVLHAKVTAIIYPNGIQITVLLTNIADLGWLGCN
jgi:hypothetical protein